MNKQKMHHVGIVVKDINKIQTTAIGDQWDLVDLNGTYVAVDFLTSPRMCCFA